MNTCFECGGKLKLVSKIGRMAWEGEDLFEIPIELKISTCIECGEAFEDAFVKTKIANSIRGQKKNLAGPRLMQLRWIHNCIASMMKRPKIYGDKSSVYCQTVQLLQFREIILSKGLSDKSREIQKALHTFLLKQWPDLGSAAYPNDVSLEDELAPILKIFCDVWINT